MPGQKTPERSQRDKEPGKSPATQAREFVRQEFHPVRESKHGAKSLQQAMPIGRSKARRAAVDFRAPEAARGGQAGKQRLRDLAKGRAGNDKTPGERNGRYQRKSSERRPKSPV
jgi:hypothetical protein